MHSDCGNNGLGASRPSIRAETMARRGAVEEMLQEIVALQIADGVSGEIQI